VFTNSDITTVLSFIHSALFVLIMWVGYLPPRHYASNATAFPSACLCHTHALYQNG